jgi:hypothetical protein
MAHKNQNFVLDKSETAQFIDLQNELNKDGSKRSLSQVVCYALKVDMANAMAALNANFRIAPKLVDNPFKRTIQDSQKGLTTRDGKSLSVSLGDTFAT